MLFYQRWRQPGVRPAAEVLSLDLAPRLLELGSHLTRCWREHDSEIEHMVFARNATLIDRDRGTLPVASAGGVKLHISRSLID